VKLRHNSEHQVINLNDDVASSPRWLLLTGNMETGEKKLLVTQGNGLSEAANHHLLSYEQYIQIYLNESFLKLIREKSS